MKNRKMKNKKVIRLTESDLNRIVKRVLVEQEDTNSDLVKCLSQKGFQKNVGGIIGYTNEKFNVYNSGEYLVSVSIKPESNNVVTVIVFDGKERIYLPKFKWNQNCDMFLDLLKNRIKEKISNKGGLSNIKISG